MSLSHINYDNDPGWKDRQEPWDRDYLMAKNLKWLLIRDSLLRSHPFLPKKQVNFWNKRQIGVFAGG